MVEGMAGGLGVENGQPAASKKTDYSGKGLNSAKNLKEAPKFWRRKPHITHVRH